MKAEVFTRKPAAIEKFSKDTLQVKAFRQIAKMILDGSIVPGEVVTVQSLANAFGVSTMPVREALRMHIAANALSVVSGRSVGVPPLDRGRLTDLRNVRVEIEPIAAGWAAERRTDAEVKLVEGHLKRLQRVSSGGDPKAYVEANFAFHFSIYGIAKSENLLRIIENLWLQISPYFNTLPSFYSTSNEHHHDMYEALRKSDPMAIGAAVRADIDSAYRVLVERVPA